MAGNALVTALWTCGCLHEIGQRHPCNWPGCEVRREHEHRLEMETECFDCTAIATKGVTSEPTRRPDSPGLSAATWLS